MSDTASAKVAELVATSAFPPSFEGNPWSYGAALFSLTLITALSLAQLLHYWFEGRARRAAARKAENLVAHPLPFFSAVNVHRMIVSGLLMTVISGALPDVLVLLAWGEASASTMNTLFALDRIGDAATLGPFLWSIGLLAWSAQAMPQRLIAAVEVPLARPAWHMIRDRLKIVGAVLAIAVGVTLAKAAV